MARSLSFTLNIVNFACEKWAILDYAINIPNPLFTQGIRMSPFLKVALEAAQAAQLVIDKYYAGEFEVEIKPDQSPVTIADIETEETIKK